MNIAKPMPPQTFYAFVCKSVDRTERPSLRRRLEPLGMLIVQLFNIALIGGCLYGIGWLSLWTMDASPRHFCYTYMAGVLYGMFMSMGYVTLQSSFVVLRNFIWPS
jgi:hypothetical protein